MHCAQFGTALTSCFAGLTVADIIAISAAIIALCAMAATFWQAYLMRKHNRLSVRPHVDDVVSMFPDKPVALTIVNNGLGPAIVNGLHINLDGVEYLLQGTATPKEIREQLEKTNLRVNWNIVGPNTPIATGGSVVLISFNDTAENPLIHNQAVSFLKRFGFTLEYRSLYDEKFKHTYPRQQ